MPRKNLNYSAKIQKEELFTVPNRLPEPRIKQEWCIEPEFSELEYQWNWSKGLPAYERLYQHKTLSISRKNTKASQPRAPRDELDFVLDSVFTPLKTMFPEKGDPYIQVETVLGHHGSIRRKDGTLPTWRVLKNRIVINPPRKPLRDHPIVYGGVRERGNIFNVKLGIPSSHSPQTNAGYSRTPSGGFYAI